MRPMIICLCGFLSLGAEAAEAKTPAPRAAELVAEAEGAYLRGDPDLAVKLYRRAYGLTPDPRLLLVLAHVHEQALEDLPGAIIYYQLYLASQPSDAEVVRAELEAAQQRSGEAHLQLSVRPSGLTVRLGGEQIDLSTKAGKLSVVPGTHQLDVFEAERVRHSEPLVLEPGLNRVHVELQETAPPPPGPPRTLSWALTGAALGTGVAWGALATWAQAEQDRDLAGAADVLLGIAATSAVGAVVAWILE